MEPLFQKVSISSDQSIFVKDTFSTNFHFHGEYELIYFLEGNGECIVGDRVKKYQAGNIFLLAPNLPHCFTNAPGIDSKSLVVQFRHKAFMSTALQHPELHQIARLLEQGQKGLLFEKGEALNVEGLIEKDGFERYIMLLEILKKLSQFTQYESLSSPTYSPNVKLKDYHRINEVYSYIEQNFKEKIRLEDISGTMNITTSAFCRYFKKITKKSFFTYLNEYRIGKACGMLRQSDDSISMICYASGFESIANFNRQFQKYIGSSPREYRKNYVLISET
ncbi:MAG: helix-turn-helix domain-containing protein [Cyclobacteriaceae bacterium]